MKFIDSCRFMQTKLSDLVDNLSEINDKECKKCMEIKRIRSECEFIGLKDNRLKYKRKECDDTSAKSVDDLIKKFPITYKFCDGNLNKFVLLLRKAFILMSIWIAGKDLMKHYYHPKKLFLVN